MNMLALSTAGFRACGLHPFDANAINYTLLRNLQTDSTTLAKVDTTQAKVDRPDSTSTALKAVESKLESTLLAQFKTIHAESGTWPKNSKDFGLFNFWQSLKEEESTIHIDSLQ